MNVEFSLFQTCVMSASELTCRPFFLYLRGKPDKGRLKLSTGVPRTLGQEWDIALTQVTYTRTDDLYFEEGSVELLFFCENDEDQFKRVASWYPKWFRHVKTFPTDFFTKYRYAHLVELINQHGQKVPTPSGRLKPLQWVNQMNDVLRHNEFYKDNRSPYVYFSNEDATLPVIGWQSQITCDHVKILPLFNANVRRILGLPELNTYAFRKMIDNCIKSEDIPCRDHRLYNTQAMMFECNLVEHNGEGEEHHTCSTSLKGHVLRIVSPSSVLAKQNIEFDDRYYIPVQSSGFTEVTIDVTSPDTGLPVCFNGCVSLVLHFRPRTTDCKLLDRELHPRAERAVTSTALRLSDTYVDVDPYRVRDLNFNLSGRK